jgi:hypothetical protein
VTAANADPEYEHAGYFLAWAARVAEERQAGAGLAHRARSLELDPELARTQLAAAEHAIEEEELDHAREIVALVLALAPHDARALELKRRLRAESADRQ